MLPLSRSSLLLTSTSKFFILRSLTQISVPPTGASSSFRLKPNQKVPFGRDPRLPKPSDPPVLMPDDIEEFFKNFDTTLTPEQQEKVARLKRQIIPANGPRTIGRNVPTKEELAKVGIFIKNF